jgi:hypothetical protein
VRALDGAAILGLVVPDWRVVLDRHVVPIPNMVSPSRLHRT